MTLLTEECLNRVLQVTDSPKGTVKGIREPQEEDDQNNGLETQQTNYNPPPREADVKHHTEIL